MDEALVQELEALASQPGKQPHDVRVAAKDRLNGCVSGHPLLVHCVHKGGVAMRIERNKQPTLWVAVPPGWLKLEP